MARYIDAEALKNILDLHKKWVNDEDGGARADLSDANLIGADLIDANLIGAKLIGANLIDANLIGADLSDADLSGANIDFSCWPLWCGSLDVKIDKRIFCQLAYHLCRTEVNDEECKAAQRGLAKLANQFHRVSECGEIAVDCGAKMDGGGQAK